MPTHGDFPYEDFEIRLLDGAPPPRFDCGSEDLNRFFHERAWVDQMEGISVTYVYWLHGLLAGFATVVMAEVILSQRERGWRISFESLGALKLAQLGVDLSFHGRGVGLAIVNSIVQLARNLSVRVGCRYVVVDARHDVVAWYESKGFRHNRRMQRIRADRALQHGRDPSALAQSMRFDIRG